MLVFAKERRGILYIGKEVIYGSEMIQGPRDVPYAFYKEYINALEDATYREGYLRQIFKNNDFPEIAFRYSEIFHLHNRTLNKIIKGMKIKGVRKMSREQKIWNIKHALRKNSPDVIAST